MTIPRSVTVAGVRLKVIVRQLPDEDTFGEWHLEKKTIFIKKGLSDDDAEQTLYHEMWHACMDLSGRSFLDGFPDETLARAWDLFRPFYDTVKDSMRDD